MFSLAMARLTGVGGKEFSDATDNNGREGTTLDISPETGKEPLQDTREH
ncbi:hypothetical protein NBG4_480004 [Candidatus Sulfobium mesophilum]|uniref:Uncharacterized protein n=1 Tax=Candidatus Sulfobium mesophilum TaxID=2016548 RepID=A0A2U3QIJ7_9BACT|nr:hypothetical protein NBG4_480004 [Candidatus Sulfobium mesophilum]